MWKNGADVNASALTSLTLVTSVKMALLNSVGKEESSVFVGGDDDDDDAILAVILCS